MFGKRALFNVTSENDGKRLKAASPVPRKFKCQLVRNANANGSLHPSSPQYTILEFTTSLKFLWLLLQGNAILNLTKKCIGKLRFQVLRLANTSDLIAKGFSVFFTYVFEAVKVAQMSSLFQAEHQSIKNVSRCLCVLFPRGDINGNWEVRR